MDDPDVDGVELGRRGRIGAEEQAGRIGGDADLAAGVATQEVERGLGDRPAEVAVEDEDGERGRPVEARPMARLGRREVAAILVGEGRDDDAPHAHRPRPAQRLGVHPGVEDEDRAGPADVDRPGPRVAVAGRGDLEAAAGRPAERLDAEQRQARDVERQGDPRTYVADDAVGRRLQCVHRRADRHPPAAVGLADELAARARRRP